MWNAKRSTLNEIKRQADKFGGVGIGYIFKRERNGIGNWHSDLNTPCCVIGLACHADVFRGGLRISDLQVLEEEDRLYTLDFPTGRILCEEGFTYDRSDEAIRSASPTLNAGERIQFDTWQATMVGLGFMSIDEEA